jgi:hypothetical protein
MGSGVNENSGSGFIATLSSHEPPAGTSDSGRPDGAEIAGQTAIDNSNILSRKAFHATQKELLSRYRAAPWDFVQPPAAG